MLGFKNGALSVGQPQKTVFEELESLLAFPEFLSGSYLRGHKKNHMYLKSNIYIMILFKD